MSLGAFCLVLHSHIPYVLGHGTFPHGSDMLYEGAAETYLPLLQMIDDLARDGIAAKINVSLTPVVMEQLNDQRFKGWFVSYLENKANLAAQNEEEFAWRQDGHLQYLARRWREQFHEISRSFREEYHWDMIGALRRLQDSGHIEVMTSGATHGYLPLLKDEGSVQAQIKQGVQTYLRHFGRYPRGIWLPECAYRPRCAWGVHNMIQSPTGETWPRRGVEELLAENGIDYFIADSHMLSRGNPLPVRVDTTNTMGKLWSRIYRLDLPPDGIMPSPNFSYFVGDHFEEHPPVAVLTRHFDTCYQVWDGDVGYPGDWWYLDFHKKHFPGGLRYWRVTGDNVGMAYKQPYVPDMVDQRLRDNAGHFVWIVKETLRWRPRVGRLPVVVCAFDAELFGHWWAEGIRWLGYVLRWLHADPEVDVMTGREYLERDTPTSAITLPEASWGAGGGHYRWLNPRTVWTWQRIYDAEDDMRALVREYGDTFDPVLHGMLQQAGRELLLLQASDWQFLITTQTADDYAEQRLDGHHSDYKRVADIARRYARKEWLSEADWSFYGDLCERDQLFQDIDVRWWKI